MLKLVPMLIVVPLLFLNAQEDETYLVSFTGEGLGLIQDISLSASSSQLYLTYVLPDESSTIVVRLTPELKEIGSIQIDGLLSPCIRVHDNQVFLAGIKDENITVQVFSEELELKDDFSFAVEEPVDVHISLDENGILLAYVHRFLENDLLRQDVFVKHLNFSFEEVGSARMTNWYYWEDPSFAICKDGIILSYGDDPLVSIFDRHVVLTRLTWDLENCEEIRYPAIASEERNVVQPEMAVLESDVVLFCRITDQNFSVSKFTREGMVTVVPGNIRAVRIAEDLTVKEEIAITEDTFEQYEPAAVFAFGRIYFAYSTSENNARELYIVHAETLEGLKAVLTPEQGLPILYWILVGVILVVLAAFIVKKLSKSEKEETQRKSKKR